MQSHSQRQGSPAALGRGEQEVEGRADKPSGASSTQQGTFLMNHIRISGHIAELSFFRNVMRKSNMLRRDV